MATTKNSNPPVGDRRVRRTHTALARALLHLVDDQDLSRITVADVAEHAGVSRSTFYDHYRDVHELAEAACTAMIDSMIEALPSPGPDMGDPESEATRSLEKFFASLAEHDGLYRALLGPQGSARVADHIRRRTTAAIHDRLRHAMTGTRFPHPTASDAPTASEARAVSEAPERSGDAEAGFEHPHDVPAAYIAGALIGVAADWLLRGCPRTPAEMAALTWPLFGTLHHARAGTFDV